MVSYCRRGGATNDRGKRNKVAREGKSKPHHVVKFRKRRSCERIEVTTEVPPLLFTESRGEQTVQTIVQKVHPIQLKR